MKTKFAEFFAFAIALLTALSVFAGCKNDVVYETPDSDTQQTSKDESAESKIYEDAGKIIITDTFYPQYSEVGEYDEMKAKLKKWFDEALLSGSLFSAKVGEDGFETLFARMTKDVNRSVNEDGDELITATFTDEAVSHISFRIEATLYGHNPSLDYVIYVSNVSETENTLLIKDLYALDSNFELKANAGYTINTNRGSGENIDDFKPIIENLSRANPRREYTVTGGSSSNKSNFPFFDVIGKNEGLIMAIGWSGEWKSSFEYLSNNEFNAKAGQKYFNAVLLPKETIRTPRIVMTYFTGDEEYGHNIWRRLVISDYTPPSDDPEGFKAPLCASTWGRTIKGIKEYLPYYNNSVTELFFIDAGWYSQGHPPKDEYGVALQTAEGHVWHHFLGDWSENKLLYPNGIEEVGEFVQNETDMKFMLWWMIEDGRDGVRESWTFPEEYYFNTKKDDGTYYSAQALDLSRDDVTDHLIDYFSMYIEEKGLDCIRLDKSTSLDYHWEGRDKTRCAEEGVEEGTRRGITEAKYIENFYRVWQTLYDKYPQFMLDNCSSGGRRIDIEMTKLGVPLWRTDHQGSPEADQAMTQYLAKWIPLNCVGNVNTDLYASRSKFSAMNIISLASAQEDADKLLAALAEFKELRPYWYGDYYQLLPESRLENEWQAYQLYREDRQEGMFVTIRRTNAPMQKKNIKLEGLMEDREYTIHDFDDEGTENDIIKTGKELMEDGINVSQNPRTVKCYIISLNRIETDVIR